MPHNPNSPGASCSRPSGLPERVRSQSGGAVDGLRGCLGLKPGEPLDFSKLRQMAVSGDDTSCARMARNVINTMGVGNKR